MTSPESNKTQFERCLVCPNRPAVSRLLARAGLVAVNENCPGPDVIDRFDVTSRDSTDTEEVPKRFNYVGSQGKASDETDYFRTPAHRAEACENDPVVVAEDETVSQALPDKDGRLWVRIGRGDPAAVRGAEFDLDLDGHLPIQEGTPLEVLEAVRTVVHE